MEERVNWRGPEHFHIEKKADWYLAVIIVAVAVIVSAVLLKNYIFAIFVALAAFTLMMYASRGPRTVDIEVNFEGIIFGDYYYPYESLEAYDIDDIPEPVILIKLRRPFMPVIAIPIHDADVEKIDEILSTYIDREDLRESILHKIFEYLGF